VCVVGGLDWTCSDGCINEGVDEDGNKDSRAWVATADGRFVLPFCRPSHGVCTKNAIITDPSQLPEWLSGSWAPGDPVEEWTNCVSETELKKQKQARKKRANST
jgi:hypothetical protein